MVQTTKNSVEAAVEVAPAVEHKDTNEARIVELHVKGVSLYNIAQEVFGFQSEEAVERVLSVVSKHFPEV